MGKVSYINLPPGYEDIYRKGLQPGDRFQFSRIRVKDLFLSRARVKGITQKSQLTALAPIWAALDPGVKAAWESAGLQSGLTGWKQFVVDTCERRKAGYSGYADPNDLYQSEVGRILIESPSVGLTIEQAHPLTYYVLKKVTGTRSQYSPIAISESFGFPLELAISWKSDLVATDGEARARMYALIISSYQGRDIETVLEIPFGLTDDWQRNSVSLAVVLGPVQSYTVFIEVHHCTGNLYFDNVSITHNSENWARDPACNNISQNFTRAFFQVAKHWAAINANEGADFGSFYFLP